MKLTSKGRYAVTAMLDIAIHENGAPVPLADIAKRQDISLSYLEQLFSKLRKKKLVNSVRGPGGGYRLGIDPNQISIAMIIDAVDESVDMCKCSKAKTCNESSDRCLTHSLWDQLSARISSFLDGISLGELVASDKVKQQLKIQQIQKS